MGEQADVVFAFCPPAGPYLDRLVAERVMGWSLGPPDDEGCQWWDSPERTTVMYELKSWNPSTEIRIAWEVIEKVRSLGFEWQLLSDWKYPGEWLVKVLPHYGLSYRAEADTAPLAICRAALLLSQSPEWGQSQ